MAPVTLAEAKNNAQSAYDPFVIDEFRQSPILDTLVYDQAVNPAGGGATLTYGYRRMKTSATADTRALNNEYVAQNVETEQHSVDLAVMGGSFTVDRVIADIGPSASGAVTLNIQQKVASTRAKFADLLINGDKVLDANGFDGLSVALNGASTEVGKNAVTDWSSLATVEARLTALDRLDEFISELDGLPTMIVGSKKAIARVRAIVRGTSMYVREPVDGLVGANGRPIDRESYGGIIFAEAGTKPGTATEIVGTTTRSTKWLVAVTSATGGTYKLEVDGRETEALAHNANDATIAAAINAVGFGEIATVASKAITLTRLAVVAAGTDALTDAGSHTFTVTENSGTTGAVTDLYAYRVGLDGFHGVTTVGGGLVRTWLPDFGSAGAVKTGEVELGPVAVALKATKAAAVLRNIKL